MTVTYVNIYDSDADASIDYESVQIGKRLICVQNKCNPKTIANDMFLVGGIYPIISSHYHSPRDENGNFYTDSWSRSRAGKMTYELCSEDGKTALSFTLEELKKEFEFSETEKKDIILIPEHKLDDKLRFYLVLGGYLSA